MHRFDLRDIPVQPWDNGAGTRQELASNTRAGKTLWRLSVAAIERDCPFSAYPGYARLHMIIAGAGTRLTGEGVDLEVRRMVPVAFDGAIPLDCTLLGGPASAFNVVYDPAAIRAELLVLTAGVHLAEARDIGVFCVAGSAMVDGQPLMASQGAMTAASATITVAPNAELLCALMDPA